VLQRNISLIRTMIGDRTNTALNTVLKEEPRFHSIHALQIPSECVLLVRCRYNSHVTVATNVNGNICLTCGYCHRWNGKGRKLVSVKQPALVFLYVKSVSDVGLFDQLRGSRWPKKMLLGRFQVRPERSVSLCLMCGRYVVA
jgi:hypothetical protein